MTELRRTDSDNLDFRELVTLLDQYLAVMDGEEHAFYHQYNKVDLLRQVVVAYTDGKPSGCGAIKPVSETEMEVKRMYVRPELRGKGIAKGVLSELEKWAAELGYKTCILETGKRQTEAVNLYPACGYEIIPNYGQYAGVENSVCMKKDLR
ncbi:GNAT family N-acetyltransferase [Flavobacterium sp.]|uniref:GNAT family N-acetyltransferase n=1 Tax=Flavobacterium sp. TaxID=239 RepID=UPI0039E3E67B